MKVKNIVLIILMLLILCLVLVFYNMNKESGSNNANINENINFVEITKNPKRIVDLAGVSDILFILGLNPVATINLDPYEYKKLPPYLEDVLPSTLILDSPVSDAVDVKNIKFSNPDLILISTQQIKSFDKLNEIAPTIVLDIDTNDWRKNLNNVAETFSKIDLAEKFIISYEEKANLIGQSIKTVNGSDKTYLSLLVSGKDLFAFTGSSYGNILYNDLKLMPPKYITPNNDITLQPLSLEYLSHISADNLIILSSDEDKMHLLENNEFLDIVNSNNSKISWLNISPYSSQSYTALGSYSLLETLKDSLT